MTIDYLEAAATNTTWLKEYKDRESLKFARRAINLLVNKAREPRFTYLTYYLPESNFAQVCK